MLSRLGPNPDRAAAEYERLRLTLEKFFDWHCAWPPEECADETLDRLTFKLATEVEIVDVRAYARGIARLVLLEWRRRPAPVSMDERPWRAEPRVPPAVEDHEGEAFRACFERCLAALSAGSHAIVLEYTPRSSARRSTTGAASRRRSGFRRAPSETACSASGIASSGRAGVYRAAAAVGLEAAVTNPLEASPAHEE